MRHLCLPGFAIAALVIVLTACNSQSAEQRISEAMPIGQELQVAADALLRVAMEGGHDVAPLTAELERRKLLRVRDCAPDYSPGWFDDRWNIAAAIKGKAACFRAQDDALLAWVTERRIGVLLAAPPLIAKPVVLPSIALPVTPIHTQFARHAGVLFESDLLSGQYAVLEIATGKVLATGRASGSGALSDNGRLFVTVERLGTHSLTEIRDTTTGNVLLKLPEVPWIEWIGDIGALISQKSAGGDFSEIAHYTFRDMVTGLDTPLSFPSPVGRLRMPGDTGRIVLTHQRGLIALTVEKTSKGWIAKANPPYPDTGYHVDFDAGVTADGKRYVAALGSNLKILELDSGFLRIVSLQPFVALNMQPTPDPDWVLLTGHYGPPVVDQSERLLYSLSRGIAAVVPMPEKEDSLNWVPEYSSLMRSDYRKLDPVTVASDGPHLDLAALIAMRKPELQARALVQAGSLHAIPAVDYRNVLPIALSSQEATDPGVITGPVAELAKKARVLGIGVYEGKRYPGDARGGTVRVSVMRTKGPIILVLASSEPVRWVVTADPGAEVGAILLSGSEQAQVMGVQAPVHHIGLRYSYGSHSGGGDPSALDQDVAHWTGRGIDRFQGTYQGDMFVIRE